MKGSVNPAAVFIFVLGSAAAAGLLTYLAISLIIYFYVDPPAPEVIYQQPGGTQVTVTCTPASQHYECTAP